jgi:hypothetical protein
VQALRETRNECNFYENGIEIMSISELDKYILKLQELVISSFMYLHFTWKLEVCIGRLHLQKICYTQPLGLIIQEIIVVHT